MNEMSLYVYLYYTLKEVFGIATAISGVVSGFYGLAWIIVYEESYEEKIREKFLRIFKISISIFLSLLIFSSFIPNEKTLAMMIGVPVLHKEMQDTNSTLDQILEKTGDVVKIKLDQIVKEATKNKKGD